MHTDANRFYETLGVAPGASDKAIRVAFRRRAKQLHPDSPSGDAGAFILLKRAYDVLSDPGSRADYDRDCQPAPEPHRWAEPPPRRPMPPPVRRAMPPPRVRSRRSGMGLARYMIAFVVMAAISLAGVQAMISFTEAPPSIRTRAPQDAVTSLVSPEPAAPRATETPSAPGSSKSGFWDPNPAPAGRRN